MIIGAQLYTTREYCKTLDDFSETLKKVADIGYKTVQVSGVCPYDGAWLKTELDKNGITAAITHTSPAQIKENPAAVLKDHLAFDCRRIGIGSCPGGMGDGTYEGFVADFRPIADYFSENGAKFYYHNHHQEFVRAADGKRFIEKLCEDFPEDRLGFILDTYWVQFAGGDPVAWLNYLKGRIDCIHFKDMTYVNKAHCMVPVGEGNLNWESIIATAEELGTQYAFVEQDNCNGEDPFNCLKRSYDFLKSMGLE